MATIANLVVKIGATSKGLKKGLTNAAKRVKTFATNSVKTLLKISGALTAAFLGVGALIVRELNQVAEGIDDLAKTSAKLGVTTEALQKLQFQAQLSGVKVTTLNMAFQRMVRRVAEAAKGTGEAVGALEELNLNAESLNKLSPDRQFAKIAEAFKGIGSQSDKVRLAMKLFDSEGVALVNTLNSDLEQTGKEFDSLGISISDSQAKAVEAYNDSGTKLNAVWDGFKQQLTAVLAGPAKEMLDWVTKFITDFGGLDKLAVRVAQGMFDSMKSVVSVVETVTDAVIQAANAMRDFEDASVSVLARITGVVGGATIGAGVAIGEAAGSFVAGRERLQAGTGDIRDTPAFTFREQASDFLGEQFNVARAAETSLIQSKVEADRASRDRAASFAATQGFLDNLKTRVGVSPASSRVGVSNTATQINREGNSFSDRPIQLSVRTEEGVIVEKVVKSDKFDLIVEQKMAEGLRKTARQVAR